MMNKHTAELLEQHFHTAFAAPNGIKKLRELILTLAMQGKLVPQDPNDPPASELLKAIEAEKKRLVKEGKIKAPKPLPPVTDEEKPYALPVGWVWVRFPYCYYGIGNKSNQIQTSGYQELGTYPVVDQGKAFIAAYTDRKELLLGIEKPVIVFGDHTKNIKYIDFDFVIGADGVKTLCPYDGITPRFLFRLMQAYSLTDRGYARHFGVLNEKLAPLPPLPEQHRIVAKIDELMARCDALEKLRTEREEKRLAVHAAAISQLLNIAQADEHQHAQAFLAEHFGELYTVNKNVAELRKAILQLAVMGKLVPQDPNDPPASELLKEIEAEKKRLVKEGKIKTPKALPPLAEKEKPYPLPHGWEWVRLGNYSSIFSGNAFRSEDFNTASGIRAIKITNAGVGELIETNDYLPTKFSNAYSDFLVRKSDLILALTRPYISTGLKISICPESYDGALLNQRVASIRPYFYQRFVYLFLSSPHVLRVYQERFRDAGLQPNLKISDVTDLAIPIPPLAEQHRIVAKIDQLMALCDTLDQQIAATTNKQTELLDALMAQI